MGLIEKKQTEFLQTDKLWKLLDFALQDLQSIKVNPKYKVYMHVWHSPEGFVGNGKTIRICQVCLAGAVLSNTFKTNSQEVYTPDSLLDAELDIQDSLKNALLAIEEMRLGYIDDAWYRLSPARREELNEEQMNKVLKIENSNNFFMYKNFKNFQQSLNFYTKIKNQLKELDI